MSRSSPPPRILSFGETWLVLNVPGGSENDAAGSVGFNESSLVPLYGVVLSALTHGPDYDRAPKIFLQKGFRASMRAPTAARRQKTQFGARV